MVQLFRAEEQLSIKKEKNQFDKILSELNFVKKCYPQLNKLDNKERQLTTHDVKKLYYIPRILELSSGIYNSDFKNQNAKAKCLLYFRNEYSSEGSVTKRIKDTINFTASDFDLGMGRIIIQQRH